MVIFRSSTSYFLLKYMWRTIFFLPFGFGIFQEIFQNAIFQINDVSTISNAMYHGHRSTSITYRLFHVVNFLRNFLSRKIDSFYIILILKTKRIYVIYIRLISKKQNRIFIPSGWLEIEVIKHKLVEESSSIVHRPNQIRQSLPKF